MRSFRRIRWIRGAWGQHLVLSSHFSHFAEFGEFVEGLGSTPDIISVISVISLNSVISARGCGQHLELIRLFRSFRGIRCFRRVGGCESDQTQFKHTWVYDGKLSNSPPLPSGWGPKINLSIPNVTFRLCPKIPSMVDISRFVINTTLITVKPEEISKWRGGDIWLKELKS